MFFIFADNFIPRIDSKYVEYVSDFVSWWNWHWTIGSLLPVQEDVHELRVRNILSNIDKKINFKIQSLKYSKRLGREVNHSRSPLGSRRVRYCYILIIYYNIYCLDLVKCVSPMKCPVELLYVLDQEVKFKLCKMMFKLTIKGQNLAS